MSSRNAYLKPNQRKHALVLYRALMRVQTLADAAKAIPPAESRREQVMAEEAASSLIILRS